MQMHPVLLSTIPMSVDLISVLTYAGVYVFSEQPGAEGDRRAGQERTGQCVCPGQPLPAVCVSSGSLARLQDQPVGTH